MEFININGAAVSVEAGPKVKKPKKVSEAKHKGWQAFGYTPEAIEEARKKLEAARKKEKGAIQDAAQSYSDAELIRAAKPTKVRSKPYFSHEAAADACSLATKAGWIGAFTEAVMTKGGGS